MSGDHGAMRMVYGDLDRRGGVEMKVYENNDGMGPYEQCVQLVYK